MGRFGRYGRIPAEEDQEGLRACRGGGEVKTAEDVSRLFKGMDRAHGGSFFPAKVGPRLVACLTPRRGDPTGPAGSGRMGSLILPNPTQHIPTTRPPCQGLTRRGARALRDGAAIMRGAPDDWGFWTVTLPPEAHQALASTAKGWAGFQDTIRRRLSELLARRIASQRKGSKKAAPGVTGRFVLPRAAAPMWAFVVEPHESGLAHLHLFFRSRWRRNQGWLLRTKDLDALICNAVYSCTGLKIGGAAAGQVQKAREGAGNYLAKYVTKLRGVNTRGKMLAAGLTDAHIPLSFWGLSSALREAIDANTFELPAAVVATLSLVAGDLAESGLCSMRVMDPAAPGAPGVLCLRFHGWEAATRCVEACWALSQDLKHTPQGEG